MIVYSATKRQFLDDVRTNKISQIIENEVYRKLNRNSPKNEVVSWENSLQYMSQVLWDDGIPASAGVSIEYNIPMTNRRVDFILTGKDENRCDSAVVIELKQWQEVEKTNKDAIVKTRFQHGVKETSHPSYQAWSYTALIEDYNETVRQDDIRLMPCAYLHNMKTATVINDPFYDYHTNKAPVFISSDVEKLTNFLKKHVRYGDSDNIMYRIEHGKIKPSKNLADSLASMLKGNAEFLMIDDQKLVYETALDLVHKAQKGKKQTLIIKGGPGTGKTVVAINLLVEATKREMLAQYVTKNMAPRAVYSEKLKGTKRKNQIDQLFKGSGSYIDVEANQLDMLIVDEAHRLNEKSGMFSNLGENQVKEIICAAKLSIFFIDEAQRVTWKDIGTVEEIKRWAKEQSSEVSELELASQFRCNGSDGYLAWVDHTLQIRETAHSSMDDIDYEVVVFDDPNELRKAIIEKNRHHNKARMVAGYCWDWNSKKDKAQQDIILPEHNFSAQWNLADDGGLWMIEENSVGQVGCIHTCQGLELDYIGVIIGDDFVIRNDLATTDATKRSKNDSSIKGFKSLLKNDPQVALQRADEIIKNTYRTLMTRGQKGCYIYCVDKETQEYFKKAAERTNKPSIVEQFDPYKGLDLPIVVLNEAQPYETHVPIFELKAAAGAFSDVQVQFDDCQWVELPSHVRVTEGMFVLQVQGESMNKRIPNGSWCLFKLNPAGTRNGKIVLAQHRSIEDPDHGGSYTVKVYESVKGDDYLNNKILLKPDTSSFGYKTIEIEADETDNFKIIAEFLMVL